MAGEESRVSDGAGAVAASAVHEHDCGAVLRGDVPAGEPQTVRGLEGHRLVRRAGRVADQLAVLVRDDDREGGGEDERVDDGHAAEDGDEAIRPAAPPRRRALAAVDERDREAEADKDDAGGEGQDAGQVAAAGFDLGDVSHVQRSVDDRENAERECDPGPEARPQPRKENDRRDPENERDERRERVLARPDTRLPVEEGVVERVQERHCGRSPEDDRLPAPVADRCHCSHARDPGNALDSNASSPARLTAAPSYERSGRRAILGT